MQKIDGLLLFGIKLFTGVEKEETDLLLCNGKLARSSDWMSARSEANVPLKFQIIRLLAKKNALVVTI